jgi:hypothetical protein
MKNTHKLVIWSEILYITLEQAKNIYAQKEKWELVILKNEKTLLHRKMFSSKIDLIPLDDIESIIYNIENKEIQSRIIKIYENRIEKKVYTSWWVIIELIERMKSEPISWL